MQQPVRNSVRSYRLYFLDGGNLIASAQDIDAASDFEACERAATMLADQSDFPSIEVWERARLVRRLP